MIALVTSWLTHYVFNGVEKCFSYMLLLIFRPRSHYLDQDAQDCFELNLERTARECAQDNGRFTPKVAHIRNLKQHTNSFTLMQDSLNQSQKISLFIG